MTHTDRPFALIPLRGGSRGLPGKNLRPLAGKPLYRHAVDQALRTVGRCVITTDIAELFCADLPEGCEVLQRPAALARDDTPMAPVVAHALQALSATQGEVVLLQATSPLRRDTDVLEALALHRARGFQLTMSVTDAAPEVQKWGRIVDGAFQPLAEPGLCFTNRQALPAVYRPNGAVYVIDVTAFLSAQGFPTENMGAYGMPHARSADIDTLTDFDHVATLLMQDHNAPVRRQGPAD